MPRSASDDADIEFPPGWVQVWFRMSGGPASALGMGAELVSSDRVRLYSGAWAALNAAKGDVFLVERGADGQLWAQEKVEASGFCTIRIALTDDSSLGTLDVDVDVILNKFAALGVTGSGMFGLVVIDVPPDADLRRVRHVLDCGRRDGWWDYDELCITEAWKASALS